MTSLDPQLLAIFAAAEEKFPLESPASRQQQRDRITLVTDHVFAMAGEPAPPVASIVDHSIPVAGGRIDVRVFTPHTTGPVPGHLYFHGGSFWRGSAVGDMVSATCQERCAGAGVVVASVEYRMAPEHRFPGPLEDCYAALQWVHAEHEALGVDPGRISIGGGSAGGNLAAAVSILARDRGGPAIAFQLLEVPALDLTGGHTVDIVGLPPVDVGAVFDEISDLYLPDPAMVRDPLVSPLFADDVTGLPDTHVMTAEFDSLRGDGEAYVERLRAAGVSATGSRISGHLHVTPYLTGLAPGREWRSELVHQLTTRLAAR